MISKRFLLFLILTFINSQLFSQANSVDRLPLTVDISESDYFPPIINQGEVGACDWCAVTYYQMTTMINTQQNRKATPENTFSPQFGYPFSCNAKAFPYNIRIDDVYKFATKHGMGNMANIPYKMTDGSGFIDWCVDAEIWEDALKYRIKGYEYFTLNNKSYGAAYSLDTPKEFLFEVKRLLNEGEVLVIQSETPRSTSSLINDDKSTNDDDRFVGQQIIIEGNNGYEHTVAVVGYNDHIWYDENKDGKVQLEEKGAIKIAESFGEEIPTKLNKGFHWMTYKTFVNSIAENRVNRMILRENYAPKVLCKITLNTAERDKIKFQFGKSITKKPEDISSENRKIFDPYMLGYNPCTAGVSLIEGGNVAYDGGAKAKDGSFVFDLTEIYEPGENDYWYLKISNSSSTIPCTIKKFEIHFAESNKVVSCSESPLTILNEEKYLFTK